MLHAEFKPNHSIAFTLPETGGGTIPMKGWIKSATADDLTFFHEEGGIAVVPMDLVIMPVVGKKKVAIKDMVIKRQAPEAEPKKYDAAAGAKAPKPGSQQEKVSKLYAANADKSRKEVIALIMSEIGMSPAGASTYYQNAKKAAMAAE